MPAGQTYELVYRGEFDEYIVKRIHNCAGTQYYKHLVVFTGENNSALFTVNSTLVVTISPVDED